MQKWGSRSGPSAIRREAAGPIPGPLGAGTQLDPLSVRKTLMRILATPEFTRSPMTAKFLSYIVEETLSGKGQELKEYSVATEGLGKPETFDPRSDATVRVQANRLRSKLKRYYVCTAGIDQVVISLQPGRYAPTFRLSTGSPAAPHVTPGQSYVVKGVAHQGSRYYERARHYLSAAHEGALDESIAYFVDAIGVDPGSTRALAGLSYACALTGLLDDREPGDLADIGRRAAQRALELESDTPEACVALGVIACIHDFDFDTAQDWMDKAAGLHTDTAFWQTAFQYLRSGHWTPIAGEGYPISDSWLINHFLRAWSRGGGPAQGYVECGAACALCKTFAGLSHLATGQYLDAIDTLKDGCKLAPLSTHAQGALAYAYGCYGDLRRARDILNSMVFRSAGAYVSKVDLAKAFLGLGNEDRSLALLREAIDERSSRVITIGISPEFAGLRGDPRFDALLDAISVDHHHRGPLDMSVA